MKGNFATATYYRDEKEIEGTLLQSFKKKENFGTA
jgi:hypothetical protein